MELSAVPPIEIGSLSAQSPEESQFIGSSSGVFFVNTVYRAFAKNNHAKQSETGDRGAYNTSEGHDHLSAESCIIGPETDGDQNDLLASDDRLTRNLASSPTSYGSALKGYNLGCSPSQDVAKELIKTYFQSWHPLFPFLYGKSFLSDVDLFYAQEALPPNPVTSVDHRKQTCRAVIFQCVFNIAALDRMDLYLPPECAIQSSTDVLAMIGTLGIKHDLTSLQALLAAQLYLIATMSLQPASIVGGVLLRSLFHAGYHRCPSRYSQLSKHDGEIRKRIFWSAYIADRYLSQALGIPLGIQDSDIDVCVPGGEELHRPVGDSVHPTTVAGAEEEVLSHLPHGHPNHVQTPPDGSTRTIVAGTPPARSDIGERRPTLRTVPQSSRARPGGDVFQSYIAYCRIVGQALELFHKSIHSRAVKGSSVLMLNSEINGWWNSLPSELQYLPDEATKDAEGSFAAFFSVIYQQLILLVNRPFLSRNLNSPDFRSSMQTCISSSRLIVRALNSSNRGNNLFSRPGVLSSLWMAGLVLAFACQLDLYPFKKGTE